MKDRLKPSSYYIYGRTYWRRYHSSTGRSALASWSIISWWIARFRSVLEVLRQPMEDGVVHIASSASFSYPAKFYAYCCYESMPCSCYLGDPDHPCCCTDGGEIRRYSIKISGPLFRSNRFTCICPDRIIKSCLIR